MDSAEEVIDLSEKRSNKPRSLQEILKSRESVVVPVISQDNDTNLDNVTSTFIPYENDEQNGEQIIEQREQPLVTEETEIPSSSISLFGLDADLNEIFGKISSCNNSELGKSADELRLEEELKASRIEVASLKGYIQMQKQDFEKELSDKILQIEQQENEQFQQFQTETVTKLQQLQTELNQITLERDDLLDKLSKFREDGSTLKADLGSTKTEYNRLKMEHSLEKKENERLKAEIEHLKEELNRQEAVMEAMKGPQELQLRQFEITRQQDEQQIRSLQQEIDGKQQTLGKLTLEYHNSERFRTTLTADYNNLQTECNKLQQKVAQGDALHRELDNATWRISSLENENRDLTTQIAFLRNSQHTVQSQPTRQYPPPIPPERESRGSYISSSSSPYSMPYPEYRPTVDVTALNSSTSSSAHKAVPPPVVGNTLNAYSSRGASPIIQDSMYTDRPQSGPVGSDDRYDRRQSVGSRAGYYDADLTGTGKSNANNKWDTNETAHSLASSVPNNIKYGASGSNDYNNSNTSSNKDRDNLPIGGGYSSLANVLGSRRGGGGVDVNSTTPSTMYKQQNNSDYSPFATDKTSAHMQTKFENMDRHLTTLMTEKTNLLDESERLHQRGLKVLKDRTRLTQVEQRLGELGKEIASVRKQLTAKPN